jgi:hypothetical protein
MTHLTNRVRPIGLAVILVLMFALSGCSGYQMRGVVVEGARSTVMVVDEDDPRLTQGHAVPLATIEVTLDPDRLSRKDMPPETSDVDGRFAVTVDEPGAGYLEYEARILVRRAGHDTAVKDLRIPGPRQRLLVTLVNGEDKYEPKPPDVLEETMKMGEPYMR